MLTEMSATPRAVIEQAQDAGLCAQELLAGTGFTQADLEDPDGMIPCQKSYLMIGRAIHLSRDPDLPLRAIERIPFGAYQVVDFLTQNSATIGDGMGALAKFFPIINNTLLLRIEERADGYALRRYKQGNSEGADMLFAIITQRFSQFLGAWFQPVWVSLRRGPLRDATLSLQCFGPRVVFGASHDEMFFPREVWSRPMPHYNQGLCRVLAQHAELLRRGRGAPGDLTDLLAFHIEAVLDRGEATLPTIATRMGISPRTLQRRLKSRHTSFQEILDKTRASLAHDYLRRSDITIAELSHYLGYADETAFLRAFKRWTGTTPSAITAPLSL